MIKTFPLAVVCCFLLAAAIRADAPPAEPPIDPAVAKLVEQLGDNDFRVREEASRRLKAIGLPALPALRKALTCPDAEVRRRANELVPALETAALLAAKRVTFKIV
ncbi:MAG TPA: HEAT repeat domain-containing protein, partial [Gemmataceae bacterium]|nr:HEAT repeat domain-containing protein [Gemmataceae bacterium]